MRLVRAAHVPDPELVDESWSHPEALEADPEQWVSGHTEELDPEISPTREGSLPSQYLDQSPSKIEEQAKGGASYHRRHEEVQSRAPSGQCREARRRDQATCQYEA